MKPLPPDPMGQHARFIDALCADWLEAGTVTRNTPRADAVIEISKQTEETSVTERCADCGKFVPYAEMEEGGGARFHFEPLNEFGPEVAEWTCARCNQSTREPAQPNKRAGRNS